jgi:hypothetical protein
MARLPWLSASCSRSELDSSSSLSLLHSIYGSQVSQVLLASDDSDFRSDDSARPDSLAVARRASRPKSSPAVTRLERQRSDVETAVHVVPKQKPRARPATAGVRRSVSLQRGGAVGRPKSALTPHVPPLLLEDVEAEESCVAKNAIHDTKPVSFLLLSRMDCVRFHCR